MAEESSAETRRVCIGYALPQKKINTLIQPSLIDHAKSRGIDLIPIDTTKPLIEQGSFDCIVHKVYDQQWKNQLKQFSLNNPNIPIIDPPDSIETLHSRTSMLQVVNELNIESLTVPIQIAIYDSDTLSLSSSSLPGGLKFPVIAKPLVANATATSHEMSLVFNSGGLIGLKPPIVLQEFVNHGGVIFKVYVAGRHVKCVKRNSISDISEEKMKLGEFGDSVLFSQISNFATSNDSQEAIMPPLGFINEVANGLREGLKLHLFNFDLIRDSRADDNPNRYLVIDINYFPGYAKIPNYESILTDFFWEIVNQKEKKQKMHSE